MAMTFDFLLPEAAGSPLGRVSVIATIEASRGVEPRGEMRIFGAFGITLILEGSGLLCDAAGRTSDVGAGDLILTFPETPHWFGPREGATWNECYAVFDGPLFEFLRDAGILDPRRLIARYADPQTSLASLEKISKTGGTDCVMSLAAFLTDAFGSTYAPGPEWLVPARTLLASALHEPRGPREVASALGLGYETFRKGFQKHVGTGPAGFRARRRLEIAAELVKRSSSTCAEIADHLGYPDVFTFSKAFKREFGASPTHFRRG